jgi:hypothetical protein
MPSQPILLVVVLAASVIALSAQVPVYEISIPPTMVTQSWYDYMIGGYHNLPMQEIPPQFGGGRVMTYHARRTSNGLRKVYFTYINDLGQMQTVADPWQDVSHAMGYPSVAMDRTLGKPFYA